MATSINSDFNNAEVIYHSEDSVEKVADWFSTQLKQKGVAIKKKILFILPLEPEIKKQTPQAKHTVTIEPRKQGSLIRIRCSSCY